MFLEKSSYEPPKNNYYNMFLGKVSHEPPKNNNKILSILYYDRIEVSEGIDINKTCASKRM